jgi:uncharacterized SAM-binding protein YcdF (DUF218 family)
VRRILLAAAGALLAAWLASFTTVAIGARRDTAARADAIIVLGAAQYNGRPSPVFKARLDQAARLWRARLAPLVVVTGGVGQRDTVSEAAVARRYLLEAGLPDSAIEEQAVGRSSEPSLRAAARHVHQAHGRRVILVSDGFHLVRLSVLARRMGLEPTCSPAVGSPIRASWRRELGYLLAESVKTPVAFLITRGS